MIGLMKQKDVGQGHGTLRFKSNSGTTYTVELSKGKILSLKDHRGNEYELPEIQKYWEEGFPLIGAIAATIGDDGSSQPDEEEKQMLYSPEELQETQSSETVGGRYGIKVNSVNPSLGNKRSTWLYKNEAGVIVRFNSEREAEEVIEKLKKDTSIADRTMKSYQIAPLKGESELPRKRCERCGKPVNPGISSTKCPSCHESSLEDAERHYGVQETVTDDEVGMGCNVGDTTTQISPVALSEEAPPGFPKSIYEKLVIKFKGDKRKINEVMWELHNKSKRTVHSLDEKDPPGFPKSIRDKLLTRYKSEPEKAYAIMWKLHNEHGDKLESVVNEAKKKIVKKKTKTDSRQSQGIDCMVAGGPN
jgi:rubrerythrin